MRKEEEEHMVAIEQISLERDKRTYRLPAAFHRGILLEIVKYHQPQISARNLMIMIIEFSLKIGNS